MSDTYTYMHKQLKQAFIDFDVDAVDYYLKNEMFGELAYMIHLINKTQEEGVPISQFHEEALTYINNKWGSDTPRILKAMREVMWDEIKAGKYKKQKPLSPEERKAKRQEMMSQLVVINC